MTAPRLRSRTLRRIKRKTPGGRVVMHYKARSPQHAHCANCGKRLAGVPRAIPSALGKIPKSQRRPERPFGGVLCSGCMREHYRKKVSA